MPNQTLHIVLVPGLDDGRYNLLNTLSRFWSRADVKLHVHSVGWRDSGSFEQKLEGLLSFIDELLLTNEPVALIGTSAGGSMVLNAYLRRPNLLGVINVCGRLHVGHDVSPTLEEAAWTSAAFDSSVRACDQDQHKLSNRLRKRVLILQPWRDPVVPLVTMLLEGATVKRISGFAHVDGIVFALLFRRAAILRFLRAHH